MSDQTNCILNGIFKDEKFIETYTPYFKRFKEIIRQSKNFCQGDNDENKDLTI